MDTFINLLALHVFTTALGVFYIYRRGVTAANVTVVGSWTILFFPVAYNVMKFI